MAYTSGSQSITEGSQGGNLDAGTEMKTTEELGLLVYSPSHLSYNGRVHLPKDGPSHHWLAPPTTGWPLLQQLTIKKTPPDTPIDHPNLVSSSTEALPS